VALVTTVAIAWLVVGVGLLGIIAVEALTLSDEDCRTAAPGDTGEASWQWWPPGSRCHTTVSGLTYDEPSPLRGWLLVAEVVVGVGLVVVWRRWRNTPEPDWAA
jgi:hypothetical protein